MLTKSRSISAFGPRLRLKNGYAEPLKTGTESNALQSKGLDRGSWSENDSQTKDLATSCHRDSCEPPRHWTQLLALLVRFHLRLGDSGAHSGDGRGCSFL